jgi:hypothetical protein
MTGGAIGGRSEHSPRGFGWVALTFELELIEMI